MRRPQAICFDMGYTLLQHAPTGSDLYTRVLAEAGHDFARDDLDAASAAAREFYVMSTRSGREFESSMELAAQFWGEYNAVVLDRLGVPAASHAELGRRIYEQAWSPAAWQIYPDVLSTLWELRGRGISMAVVSNFVDTLPAVCAAHQLTPCFDDVIASVAVGAMKPDPRIFAVALRRLGVAPEDAWHVGDNYWTDVMGARAAGMTPILVDRAGAVPHADCISIERLDQLIDLVAEARGAEAA